MLTRDDPILPYQPLWGAFEAVELTHADGNDRVYRARRRHSNGTKDYAVRLIRIPSGDREIARARGLGLDGDALYGYFASVAERAAREFRLLHALRGEPNIVTHEDCAVFHEEGELAWTILVRMELLTPLSTYLERHSISPQDVRRLGVQMCAALDACARTGVVHGDIDESSIFVAEDGCFKLGEFNFARGAQGFGGITIMPAFCAPETLYGEPHGVSSDICALGMMLYRLLNGGRYPFTPAAHMPIGVGDVETAIRRRMGGESLPPPAHGDGALKMAVLKACAFRPRDRYKDAGSFRAALDAPRTRGPFVGVRVMKIINVSLLCCLAVAVAGMIAGRIMLHLRGNAAPTPDTPVSITQDGPPGAIFANLSNTKQNAMNAKNGGKTVVSGARTYVSRNSAESGGGVLVFDDGLLIEERLLPGRNISALCVYEDRLYYADEGAGGRLGYVSLADGTTREFGEIRGVSYIQFWGDWLYYAAARADEAGQGLWRVRPDGTAAERIWGTGGIRSMCVIDGWCYYIDGDDGLTRLSLRGDGVIETVFAAPVDDYAFFENGLLLSAEGLWQTEMDGGSPRLLAKVRCKEMIVTGERLFYADPVTDDALLMRRLAGDTPPRSVYNGCISRLGADAHSLFFATETGVAVGKITSLALDAPELQ